MIQKTLEETKQLVWPEIEKYLSDPIYPIHFKVPKVKKIKGCVPYTKIPKNYWKV